MNGIIQISDWIPDYTWFQYYDEIRCNIIYSGKKYTISINYELEKVGGYYFAKWTTVLIYGYRNNIKKRPNYIYRVESPMEWMLEERIRQMAFYEVGIYFYELEKLSSYAK